MRFTVVKKFIKVWLLVTKMAAQTQLTTNLGGYIFIIGKIVRFLLYFLFLYSVVTASETLLIFTQEQVIVFFLVFNFVDIVTQFLFRGVYVFRWRVVSGDFDLDLVKPLPSFFRPLFAWTDILDFITLIPLTSYGIYYLLTSSLVVAWWEVGLFFLLFINALLIAFAIHLFISAIGVMTTEIDHLVWIWRDFFSLARFPTDIYSSGIRALLTFVIPIVIAVTVPAKILMGLTTWPWLVFSFIMGISFTWSALKFWRFALTRYSSASS